jgi:hypothetical protein
VLGSHPLHLLHLDSVGIAPGAERHQRGRQSSPERRHGVIYARRDLPIVGATYDPISLQLFQLLDQHFFADARYQPAQLSEATSAAAEVEEDERLPFSANDSERNIEPAGKVTLHSGFPTLTKR